MNLKLEIRRNADGVTATDVWSDWKFSEFWWSDGNASCDCNRELFFVRAQGGNDREADIACSEGRFSVRLSDADSGQVLYDEISCKEG